MGATRTASVLAAALALALGCDRTYLISRSEPPDGARARPDATIDAPPASTGCRAAAECDDGVFCNGAERCGDPLPGATERRCLGGRAPCPHGERCVESGARCEDPCPDADGDGHGPRGCGGDDCDDRDPTRAPGLDEICDIGIHDEDCDPFTVGVRDEDGDGDVSRRCCNVRPSGGLACGSDCDDTDPSTHAGAPEICNGWDDDCDGSSDDGVTEILFLDRDGDGYGTSAGVEGCRGDPGLTPAGGDCDDVDPARHPDARESCDASDEDCDGVVDEDVPRCP